MGTPAAGSAGSADPPSEPPAEDALALRGALASLSAEDRRALRSLAVSRAVTRDDVLAMQGDRTQQVLVVVRGHLKIVTSTQSGTEVLLSVCGPGEVLGDLAAIDGQPRSASIVALEPGLVLQIPGPLFVDFLHERPEALLALLRSVSGRLRQASQRLVDRSAENADTRLARQLLWLFATHGEPSDDGPELTISLSQADLAASIGASREAVNHALTRLRNAGAIRTGRRQLVLTDLELVRTSAGLAPR